MSNNLFGLDRAMQAPQTLVVTKVTNGWNVRMRRAPARSGPGETGLEPLYNFCFKCRHHRKVHYHHIVSRGAFKGRIAEGLLHSGVTGDELDNKIPLCVECHTGKNGIHSGKWKIEDVIPHEKLVELRIRYGVRKEETDRWDDETPQGDGL